MKGTKLLEQLERSLREREGGGDDNDLPTCSIGWKDYPLTWVGYGGDKGGCVREGGLFDTEDIMQGIINQAYEFFKVVRDQAVKDAGRKDSYEIQIWTEPSWEDTAQTMVIDDKNHVLLYHEAVKPWNFQWETPQEMADEMGRIYATIFQRLHWRAVAWEPAGVVKK